MIMVNQRLAKMIIYYILYCAFSLSQNWVRKKKKTLGNNFNQLLIDVIEGPMSNIEFDISGTITIDRIGLPIKQAVTAS